MSPVVPDTVLAPAQWREHARTHAARADALTAGHRERRSAGRRHPLEDFLFEYYQIRPNRLRVWHPGLGTILVPDAAASLAAGGTPSGGPPVGGFGSGLAARFYTPVTGHSGADVAVPEGAVRVDGPAFMAARGDQVRWIHHLLGAVAGRPASFGCFGMHEWAMVYQDAASGRAHRHPLPLRLSDAETDAVVDQHTIRCCHVDAYRFFTAQARPRNVLEPSRERQAEFDQAGCLHVGMDLYKWAAKLSPAAPGELVLDALELALDARELDMRASPYDVTELGLDPVPVETAAGKADYVQEQRRLAQRAAGVRSRILEVTGALVAESLAASPAVAASS